MIQTNSFSERIQQVFQPTPRGVIGLVDDLMGFCREQHLRLEFQDGHCYVRPLEGVVQDRIDVPLKKSVFRALLARIAALCNEMKPNSVTPYHGEGLLAIATNPPAAFHVAFRNTPSELRLEVRSLAISSADPRPSAGPVSKLVEVIRLIEKLITNPAERCVIADGNSPEELSLLATRDGYLNLVLTVLRFLKKVEAGQNKIPGENCAWDDEIKTAIYQLAADHNIRLNGTFLFESHLDLMAACQMYGQGGRIAVTREEPLPRESKSPTRENTDVFGNWDNIACFFPQESKSST